MYSQDKDLQRFDKDTKICELPWKLQKNQDRWGVFCF
jgi:hypothetical protein